MRILGLKTDDSRTQQRRALLTVGISVEVETTLFFAAGEETILQPEEKAHLTLKRLHVELKNHKFIQN